MNIHTILVALEMALTITVVFAVSCSVGIVLIYMMYSLLTFLKIGEDDEQD